MPTPARAPMTPAAAALEAERLVDELLRAAREAASPGGHDMSVNLAGLRAARARDEVQRRVQAALEAGA